MGSHDVRGIRVKYLRYLNMEKVKGMTSVSTVGTAGRLAVETGCFTLSPKKVKR